MSENMSGNIKTWQDKNNFEVDYTFPVTFENVNALIREVREAIEYQKCNNLKINLNSPGGEFRALTHYIWFLTSWRNKGIKVETEGLVSVGSAAAVMFALGDIGKRRAYPHTEFIFHNARLSTVNSLTADRATYLKDSIDKVDQSILDQIAQHILPAVQGAYPRENVQIAKTRFTTKELDNDVDLLKKIKVDLDRLFRLDEPITATQAYQFYLLDVVMNAY